MRECTIVANPSALHQQSHASALAAGLREHGISVEIVQSLENARTRHVACWGWRCGEKLRAHGKQVLVMERGYLGDRFAWTSLAWNGLNGLATFAPAPEDGGERFRRHFGSLLRPWNPAGRYVLVIGQVPGDKSLRGRDLRGWYAQQAEEAAAAGLPVFFRPHPVAVERGHRSQRPNGVAELRGDLGAALADARLVVTYNSNTGVDALLAGKRTVVTDCGGMAWGVAKPSIAEAIAMPEPDRASWLADLAWRQWTMDEIRSGEAWQTVGAVSPEPMEVAA